MVSQTNGPDFMVHFFGSIYEPVRILGPGSHGLGDSYLVDGSFLLY